MYVVISSIIAAIPFLILPTMSPGLVFLSVAFAASVGIILVVFVWPRIRGTLGKSPEDDEVKSKAQKEVPTTETKTGALKPWRQQQIMKLGFQSLVKQDLLAIERQLVFQTPKRIDFESWNDTDAETKKRYIDKETVYRTIDNIAKVLNEWNTELDRASLLMLEPNSVLWLYIQSCKKYYEKLRAIEFLS
jgi:hypothetical protein